MDKLDDALRALLQTNKLDLVRDGALDQGNLERLVRSAGEAGLALGKLSERAKDACIIAGHSFFSATVSVDKEEPEPYGECKHCKVLAPKIIYREEGGAELYELHVFCDDCHDTHPAVMFMVKLKPRGPRVKLADAFAPRPIPDVITLRRNRVQCEKSGKLIEVADPKDYFLVRSAWKPYANRTPAGR